MNKLEELIHRTLHRVNLNLKAHDFDCVPYLEPVVSAAKMGRYYAFYGISAHHPLRFRFHNSSLAGSYFLGNCEVEDSVLYKTDVRGDELRRRGEIFRHRDVNVKLDRDEVIAIADSVLIKSLIHNRSHDPENPERFRVRNSASCPFANIHGSPMEGSFLGAFATADLTVLHECIVGPFSYVQAGEIWHERIEAGRVWVRKEKTFEFLYKFPKAVLSAYIRTEPGKAPAGRLVDFLEERKEDFRPLFDVVHLKPLPGIPRTSFVSRYAVMKPRLHIGPNVLVAQRAFVQNSFLGKGANAQENCFIIDSRLEGDNVTAHGAKLIGARLGAGTFVGFNAFIRGTAEAPVDIGENGIVMPHTIIDSPEPIRIPPNHLVWGAILAPSALADHCLPLERLEALSGRMTRGRMRFVGSGAAFVQAFRARIRHILESNGAYCDGRKNRGHAQKGQAIAYHIVQPYPSGPRRGLFPTIEIQP